MLDEAFLVFQSNDIAILHPLSYGRLACALDLGILLIALYEDNHDVALTVRIIVPISVEVIEVSRAPHRLPISIEIAQRFLGFIEQRLFIRLAVAHIEVGL